MFELRQDERVFWKTMNPARLWSLYSAWFRPKHRREPSESLQTGENRDKSLASYLMGGV